MEYDNAGEVDPYTGKRPVGSSRYLESAVAGDVHGDIYINHVLDNIATTSPDDVQKNAANQAALLTKYYDEVLIQAKTSFKWAVVAAVIGLAFFFGAVIIALSTDSIGTAAISVVSGAIVEVIAGINFY